MPDNIHIPDFNAEFAKSQLHRSRALGLLCIDSSDLRKIETESGYDSFVKVRLIFERLLLEMRGKKGKLRQTDIICRHPESHDLYLVFLQPSRMSDALPMPGDVEKIADRLSMGIQNELWSQLSSTENRAKMPECAGRTPLIAVGFTTLLNNPCLETSDLISQAIKRAANNIETQGTRMRNRRQELIQYLVHAPDLLTPHFQAVFKAPDITEQKVHEAREKGNLTPLKSAIFGFESLVRVAIDRVKTLTRSETSTMDPSLLTPDLLFHFAKLEHVALELDQACLRRSAIVGEPLPGNLLINVLPRNLYYFDRLLPAKRQNGKFILEVSESEPILNLPLVQQALFRARHKNIMIAADDFGKEHAGLERIIEVAPNIIKFDRALVHDINTNAAKQVFLKGLVQVAKILKAQIIAEGVETWEQFKILQEMGIDMVQGFLLHRPQAVEGILTGLGLTFTPAAPIKIPDAA